MKPRDRRKPMVKQMCLVCYYGFFDLVEMQRDRCPKCGSLNIQSRGRVKINKRGRMSEAG